MLTCVYDDEHKRTSNGFGFPPGCRLSFSVSHQSLHQQGRSTPGEPEYQSIKSQSKIPIHQIPIQQYRSKITIHQIPNASSHKSLYRHRGSTQIPSTHNKTARMPIHHPNKIHQSQIANTSSHFWILVST